MVLIVKQEWLHRYDLFLIPARPLNDMLDRHVHRNHLAPGRTSTCLVTHHHNWTGKPHDQHVVKLIIASLRVNRINPGQVGAGRELAFPIPHETFRQIRCKDFLTNYQYEPTTFEGDFVMRLKKLNTGTNSAIKEASHYETIHVGGERVKLRGLLRKLEHQEKGVFLWLVEHIHPARKH